MARDKIVPLCKPDIMLSSKGNGARSAQSRSMRQRVNASAPMRLLAGVASKPLIAKQKAVPIAKVSMGNNGRPKNIKSSCGWQNSNRLVSLNRV